MTIQSYRLFSFSEEKSDWHLPEVALYLQDKMFIVHIGGVMVSVLALSAVDCGFKPRTMKLVFVASPLCTQY